MSTITANELKTKGVRALDKNLQEEEEVIITVHGKDKYVVMDIERYNFLRECELEAAIMESIKDIENGDYFIETVDEHLQRLKNAL
jgi:prevent-host-death family protein